MAIEKNEIIGPWTTLCRIGVGAHGEVWICRCERHDSNNKAAVKFLKRMDMNRPEYKRFCDEIKILREIGNKPGILPLRDSNLPPNDKNPPNVPWLATPIARPLTKKLPENYSIEKIVSSFYKLTNSLCQLSENGIHHRDIKLGNLFLYNDDIALGDFGLVTYPGKDAYTREGEKIGPVYYIAPEMLSYKKGLDESLADVYSLAKVLWVLLTGQKYPLPGEQIVTQQVFRISNYVNHKRVYLLDNLIQLATRIDPVKRISLSDFTQELRAWSEITPKKVDDLNDISELNDRLQTALIPCLSEKAKEEEYENLFKDCKKMLIRPLSDFSNRIKDIIKLPDIIVDLGEDTAIKGSLGENHSIPYPLEGPAIVFCGPGRTKRPVMMSSLGLCDCGTEKTSLMAHHVAWIENTTRPKIIWSDSKDVILGCSTMDSAIDDLIMGLNNNFSKAFREFTELIEKYRSVLR